MAHHDTEIHEQMCEQMTQLQGVCVQISFILIKHFTP